MATMNAPTMDRRTHGERRTSVRGHQRSAMSALDYLAMALLIVGGLNWAMVGLFDVDMVATVFGSGSPATRILYVAVGLAALYSIYTTAKMAGSKRP
ncbi:Uncharacterized membrane protein YuzA, DUF378 family [Massilia yuzhufengensis]|uniref:Uncharacterized membrane protein YuzA, DUF378 family n=2 Tax=Massilia yuzhufengensis TaxID=1164594 RepID=A0A1I1WYJ7_9BURK|nr:Uncharacterized membrane protein YuzA, DUF378 family [Massilia yuzhufengensis]